MGKFLVWAAIFYAGYKFGTMNEAERGAVLDRASEKAREVGRTGYEYGREWIEAE